MSQFTVIITDYIADAAIETEVTGDLVRYLCPAATSAAAIDAATWASVDAAISYHDIRFTAADIAKLSRCKIICRNGVGFDNIDRQSAGENGIVVSNVPDYGTNEVADHAIGMLLGLVRQLPVLHRRVREGEWYYTAAGHLHRLQDKCLGIIGLGRIGTATALRAKAFGLRVLFYDPYICEGQDKALGLRRCYELPELLAASDIVSLHTPLTEETESMVDAAFLAQMRPGSFLVNTARGAIIDTAALAAALRDGPLAAAALDVLPVEPPPADDPLVGPWRRGESWIADRLLLTPHAAFYSEEGLREMRLKGIAEVMRVLQGEAPRNCVNRQWLVRPRATAAGCS